MGGENRNKAAAGRGMKNSFEHFEKEGRRRKAGRQAGKEEEEEIV